MSDPPERGRYGRPAVFLDRDGTLIEDKGFLADPRGVLMLPHTVQALRVLRDDGFAIVVVSNQSGVARGFFDDDAVRAVNGEIARRLANDGVAIDAWYWCSHYDDDCACRKPAPGMIERAVREHGLSLDGAAVVGDRGSDVALGHAVGIPGVLLPGPYPYDGPEPDYRAAHLLDAAEWLVRRRTRLLSASKGQGDSARARAEAGRATVDPVRVQADRRG